MGRPKVSSRSLDDLPIWLINLPGSVDRRAAMDVQLEKLGLAYRLFDAVNGRKDWEALQSSIDIPSFQRNVGRKVMPGEIGCYHSHLGVWQQLVESDAPAGLILEDDVIFHDDFIHAVNAALKVTSQWDIVKLNHIRAKFPVSQVDLGDWQLSAFLGAFTGTGAYLITRDAAAKMLKRALPIVRPIDHEIDRSHVHKTRHFGITPFPSHVEDEGESTITGVNSSGVEKFPTHQRLAVYAGRFRNLIGKSAYIFGSRR